MCLLPSSKRTGLTKLLVRYSAEQVCAKGSFHWLSGMEVLIHFEVRCFGSVITYINMKNEKLLVVKVQFVKHVTQDIFLNKNLNGSVLNARSEEV